MLSEASIAITYKANNWTTFSAYNCLKLEVEPLNNGQGKYDLIDWWDEVLIIYLKLQEQ